MSSGAFTDHSKSVGQVFFLAGKWYTWELIAGRLEAVPGFGPLPISPELEPAP